MAAFPTFVIFPHLTKINVPAIRPKLYISAFCGPMEAFCFLLNNPLLKGFFSKKPKKNTQCQISDFKFGFRSVICYGTLDPTVALHGSKDIICMLIWN